MKHYLLWLALWVTVWPQAALAEDICNQAQREPQGEVALEPRSKEGAKGVLACAYMDATTEAVYAALVDYESFPRWMDKVEGIKVEWGDAATALVDYTVGTIVGTYKYRLERVHDKGKAVRWNRLSGDLKHVSGRYAFIPIAGAAASYLVIETYVDPGKPIPGFIESYFTQKGTRRIMQDVRNEVARRAKK